MVGSTSGDAHPRRMKSRSNANMGKNALGFGAVPNIRQRTLLRSVRGVAGPSPVPDSGDHCAGTSGPGDVTPKNKGSAFRRMPLVRTKRVHFFHQRLNPENEDPQTPQPSRILKDIPRTNPSVPKIVLPTVRRRRPPTPRKAHKDGDATDTDEEETNEEDALDSGSGNAHAKDEAAAQPQVRVEHTSFNSPCQEAEPQPVTEPAAQCAHSSETGHRDPLNLDGTTSPTSTQGNDQAESCLHVPSVTVALEDSKVGMDDNARQDTNLRQTPGVHHNAMPHAQTLASDNLAVYPSAPLKRESSDVDMASSSSLSEPTPLREIPPAPQPQPVKPQHNDFGSFLGSEPSTSFNHAHAQEHAVPPPVWNPAGSVFQNYQPNLPDAGKFDSLRMPASSRWPGFQPLFASAPPSYGVPQINAHSALFDHAQASFSRPSLFFDNQSTGLSHQILSRSVPTVNHYDPLQSHQRNKLNYQPPLPHESKFTVTRMKFSEQPEWRAEATKVSFDSRLKYANPFEPMMRRVESNPRFLYKRAGEPVPRLYCPPPRRSVNGAWGMSSPGRGAQVLTRSDRLHSAQALARVETPAIGEKRKLHIDERDELDYRTSQAVKIPRQAATQDSNNSADDFSASRKATARLCGLAATVGSFIGSVIQKFT